MKTLLLFCATLLFDAGVATVHANPQPAAQALTAAVQVEVAAPDCCPDWLCAILCAILGQNCQNCCAPPSACCSSGSSCCGG